MCTQADGRRMVRKNGNSDFLSDGRQRLKDGAYQSVVQIFYGLQLELQIAIMSSLIAGLDVYIDKIIAFTQSLDSSLGLALVVGIPESCGALYIQHTQSCILTDTTNQIHGRYNGTTLNLRISGGKRHHTGAISPTPRPDTVGWVHTTLLAFYIQRMILQKLLTLENQIIEQLSRFSSPSLGGG